MTNKNISIVILNYQRPNETVECINSVQNNASITQNIIVVDNASDDNSVEIIKNSFPDIQLILSKENRGYAGGMNLGILEAFKHSPDYILILNSDTLIENQSIEILVKAMDNNKSAAMATGTIHYYPKIEDIWYSGGRLSYWRASGFHVRALDDHSRLLEKDFVKVTFISGCACLFRTDALKKVGLFDERFFLYNEDTELCSRLIRNNYELIYVPASKLFHRITKSDYTAYSIYFSIRNRLLFEEISATGFVKYSGFLYLFSTYLLKIFLWRFTRHEYFNASVKGIIDYFSRRFFEGRGFNLYNGKK
ncbi:MAG: hypothetical protein C0412_01490 [Flavobacterium sp.]|nr:hypothetical protein [Flavobacterium sp.]